VADRKNKPSGAAGAVAGGLAGKAAAEAVNPAVEDAYWRENFGNRSYAAGERYERWRPAFQYGWQSYGKYRGRKFDEVEPELRRDWDQTDGARDLTWERARSASRDAWNRVERAIPGDADEDGR
jgi:hypothetical protein